ncbi:hypothetical protein D3C80_1590650 [compost metagenome]
MHRGISDLEGAASQGLIQPQDAAFFVSTAGLSVAAACPAAYTCRVSNDALIIIGREEE